MTEFDEVEPDAIAVTQHCWSIASSRFEPRSPAAYRRARLGLGQVTEFDEVEPDAIAVTQHCWSNGSSRF